MKSWTYSKAGVDIGRVKEAHQVIAKMLESTFESRRGKFGSVLSKVGHYAGLIDIGGGKALALHADGVGTKVLIAQMMNKFDTIGIDCVAMNVNDVICVGAEPIAFVDYLALKEVNEKVVEEITKGLVMGAKEASIAIVGGETAIMPGVIVGVDGKAFDLAGMVMGVVEKRRVITGRDLQRQDVVIGVESSGIHSNGLSLARKILLSKYRIEDKPAGWRKSLGEVLLTSTRIYVKPVLEVLERGIEVSGLGHITGGAFSKLTRLGMESDVGFKLGNMPPTPEVFRLIEEEGKVSKREMYRTFNMGIGLCICTAPSEEMEVKKILSKYDMESYVIGEVVEEAGVWVEKLKID